MIEVCPALALVHADPEFFSRLTAAERLVAAHDWGLWLRPEQRIPGGTWRSYSAIAGRGFGKSLGIAVEINRAVRSGESRAPALMGPTDERVEEVQVEALVETSPPWFKAAPYKGGVLWPNGVHALAFSAVAPGRPRGGNFDLAWCTELVDWQGSERLEAYNNLATATRRRDAKIFNDTTSKGTNEIIQRLIARHKQRPKANLLVRGSLYDNPLLSRQYLREVVAQYVKGSRRYLEEVEGLVFAESAGALWQQRWLDEHRVDQPPAQRGVTYLGLDPALSDASTADETGLIEGCLDAHTDEIFATHDHSGRMGPIKWATLVVERCKLGATGCIVERNHLGDSPRDIIRVQAEKAGLAVEVVAKDKPLPRKHRPGVIYLKEVVSRVSKGTRAEGPAALSQQGRVHHVGHLIDLEAELTSWEPGTRRSPNRLDAYAFVVGELADLDRVARAKPAAAIKAAEIAARELRHTMLGGGATLGI